MTRQWWIAGLLVACGVTASFGQETKPDTLPKAEAKEAPSARGESPQPDAKSEKSDPSDAPTAEQLQQWIKALVDPKFAARQAASQKLVQAGKPGMEAVAAAAQTDDLELATRCLSVLTDGLNSKAEDVRQTAKSALQTLTMSANKSVAQRARQALESPQLPAVGAGGIPMGARNVQQIQMQVVNGLRTITVKENGSELVIKDNNGKDISVTTTETVNGQKVTQTVTGKDEDDLKKNHPQAHALFQKYTQRNGLQMQFGGNGFGGNILIPQLQARAIRPRMVNPFKAAELFDEIDKLRQKLEASNERLSKEAESEKPNPAELKSISGDIKALTKRLTEIKTELQLP